MPRIWKVFFHGNQKQFLLFHPMLLLEFLNTSFLEVIFRIYMHTCIRTVILEGTFLGHRTVPWNDVKWTRTGNIFTGCSKILTITLKYAAICWGKKQHTAGFVFQYTCAVTEWLKQPFLSRTIPYSLGFENHQWCINCMGNMLKKRLKYFQIPHAWQSITNNDSLVLEWTTFWDK